MAVTARKVFHILLAYCLHYNICLFCSSHCTRGSVCQPRVTDGKDLTKPHQKHHGITEERMPPRDVYQLRRELERMRANEISKGVQVHMYVYSVAHVPNTRNCPKSGPYRLLTSKL